MRNSRRQPRILRLSSPSNDSRLTTNDASLLYFHKPSLGDKLQAIAERSPQYLNVIELLADQILARTTLQRLKRIDAESLWENKEL